MLFCQKIANKITKSKRPPLSLVHQVGGNLPRNVCFLARRPTNVSLPVPSFSFWPEWSAKPYLCSICQNTIVLPPPCGSSISIVKKNQKSGQPWDDRHRSCWLCSLICGQQPVSSIALNWPRKSSHANQLRLHQTTAHKRISVTNCSVLGGGESRFIGWWFLQQGNLFFQL